MLADTPAGIAAERAAGMTVLAVRVTYTDDRLAAADGLLGSRRDLGGRMLGADGLELNWGAA